MSAECIRCGKSDETHHADQPHDRVLHEGRRAPCAGDSQENHRNDATRQDRFADPCAQHRVERISGEDSAQRITGNQRSLKTEQRKRRHGEQGAAGDQPTADRKRGAEAEEDRGENEGETEIADDAHRLHGDVHTGIVVARCQRLCHHPGHVVGRTFAHLEGDGAVDTVSVERNHAVCGNEGVVVERGQVDPDDGGVRPVTTEIRHLDLLTRTVVETDVAECGLHLFVEVENDLGRRRGHGGPRRRCGVVERRVGRCSRRDAHADDQSDDERPQKPWDLHGVRNPRACPDRPGRVAPSTTPGARSPAGREPLRAAWSCPSVHAR